MIEDLLYQSLSTDERLIKLLTKYDNAPAIFYQNAPHDKDKLWRMRQYPRIDYAVDWQYNAERKAAGTLSINVWCLNNDTVLPEAIEPIVRNNLSELFLTNDNDTFAILWSRSDLFEGDAGNEPMILGVTMQFDILAFPVQKTTEPDPIEGTNLWIKQLISAARVIGVDTLPSLYRAAANAPIIYCRLQSASNSMDNINAVSWISTNIAIHVFSESTKEKVEVCTNIVNRLSMDGEIVLTDKSPLLLSQAAVNTSADGLRQGQITITGRYGVLRQYQTTPVLQDINIDLTDLGKKSPASKAGG